MPRKKSSKSNSADKSITALKNQKGIAAKSAKEPTTAAPEQRKAQKQSHIPLTNQSTVVPNEGALIHTPKQLPATEIRRSTRILRRAAAKEAQPLPASQVGTVVTSQRRKGLHSPPKPRKNKEKQSLEFPAVISVADRSQSLDVQQRSKEKKSSSKSLPQEDTASSQGLPSPESGFETERTSTEASPSESTSRLSIATDIAEYYHNRGYAVPDEEYMASSINTTNVISLATSNQTNKPFRKPYIPRALTATDSQFEVALMEHKVNYYPTKDEAMETIKKLILNNTSTPALGSNMVDEEHHWNIDMEKCVHSQEAVFQRTIMITLLNRHRLSDKLDYNCEAPWISERFPCPPNQIFSATKRVCRGKVCRICLPKPDLAVAFRSESLVDDQDVLPNLITLESLSGHIFPEGNQVNQAERAFYFFAIEVKGKQGRLDNAVALSQNLNTASQALYNIYRCMKEVQELDTFFSKVRFFSAVATTGGFWLRVHRAIPATNQPNNPEYPIAFRFQDFPAFGKNYSKLQVTQIMHNVLFKYGVEKLHPILKKMVADLLNLANSRALKVPLTELTLSQVSQPMAKKRGADDMASNHRRRLNRLEIQGGKETT